MFLCEGGEKERRRGGEEGEEERRRGGREIKQNVQQQQQNQNRKILFQRYSQLASIHDFWFLQFNSNLNY